MANDLRTIELLIKATAEQGVSQRTAEQLETIAGQLFQVGKTAEVSTGKLASMTAAIARLTNNTELGRVAEQFRAIGDAASEAGQQVDNVEAKTARTGNGGGFRQSAEFQVGRSERLASTVLTAIPGGGAGIADNILRASGALTEMTARLKILSETSGGVSTAIGALTAEMAPILVAVAAIVVVMKAVESASANALKPITGFIDAMQSIDVQKISLLKLGLTATSDILDQQRVDQERSIAALQNNLGQLKAAQDALAQQPLAFRVLDEAVVHGQSSIRDAIDKTNLNLQTAKNNLIDLGDAALVAAAKMNDAINKIKGEGEKRVAMAEFDKTATPEEVRKRIAEDQAKLDDVGATGGEMGLKFAGSFQGPTQQTALALAAKVSEGDTEALDNLIKLGQGQKDLTDAQRIGLAALIAYRDSIKNAAKDEEHLTKVSLGLAEARQRDKQATDEVLKAQDERNKALAKELDAVQRLTEQMDQLQADRDKTLRRQAEQDAIDATRNAISATYAKKIQDAKDQEAEADYQAGLAKLRDGERMQERKLSESYQRQVDKINGSYMDTELKALATFRDKEADELAKFNKQYARALEDLQDKLTDAASRRDVAGFIQAQRDGEKQLRRMAEDFGDQDKARVASYAKERAAARDNRQQQLAEAERGYREQMQQLRDQLQERLDQERQAHERHVRQSQILEDQFAAIREGWLRDDEIRRRKIEAEDFDLRMDILRGQLAQQRALIAANLNGIIQSPLQGATPTAQLAGAVSAAGSVNANAFGFIQNFIGGLGGTPVGGAPRVSIGTPLKASRPPGQFAGGLPFVPSNFFPAYLDYGERVLNRRENQAYSSGRSGGTTVNVYNTVGDVATKSMLDSYQVETVRAVLRAVDR